MTGFEANSRSDTFPTSVLQCHALSDILSNERRFQANKINRLRLCEGLLTNWSLVRAQHGPPFNTNESNKLRGFAPLSPVIGFLHFPLLSG